MYHIIGQKKPNPWGVYDIYGNVGEWVQDGWHSSYEDAPTDGSAWESGYGFARIIRGGGYGGSAGECTSAYRSHILNGVTTRSSDFGFRLVMDLPNFEDSANAVINLEVNQSIYQTSDTTLTTDENFTNSIGMGFVLIPTGEFDMGSPSSEENRRDDEGPVHHVTISRAFYMGTYEVTQEQWYEVIGSNPSYFRGYVLPVEQVSWNDIQEFIIKLNEMEGTDKYRLPSEAEWEYAARAGTTTRYSFGDNESELGQYAWYGDNSGGETHPVGQKKPNPWGLYGMHGNVREWVQDLYHYDYDGAPTYGNAWVSGDLTFRVFRGGGYSLNAESCRSASRNTYYPFTRYSNLGFRLVKEV